jgi:ribosomal protein S18 acetylase RimI-like enzyme
MLKLKRINPYNKSHLRFLYETRFDSDVVKTLLSTEKPSFEKHVEYIRAKDASGHLFFLCHVEDTLVGYCQCFHIGANIWELGWVIHPMYQGRGYGTRSVEILLSEAALMCVSKVELVVLKSNQKAVSLYTNQGFKVFEDCGDRWKMRLEIKPIV